MLYAIDGKLYNSAKNMYKSSKSYKLYELMENSQIGLVVKLVLNREIIYPRLYFQFL